MRRIGDHGRRRHAHVSPAFRRPAMKSSSQLRYGCCGCPLRPPKSQFFVEFSIYDREIFENESTVKCWSNRPEDHHRSSKLVKIGQKSASQLNTTVFNVESCGHSRRRAPIPNFPARRTQAGTRWRSLGAAEETRPASREAESRSFEERAGTAIPVRDAVTVSRA